MKKITISHGFTPDQAPIVVNLFWQAFKGKLSRIMGDEERAQQFFKSVANPNFAISALDNKGHLLGVAGYKTNQGGLIGGTLKDLNKVYGFFGALRRSFILSVFERDITENTLLMDGIFVAQSARGQGVGTMLLDAIKSKATELDCAYVRLDVIDTNPRARALYERNGFIAKDTKDVWPFRKLLGCKQVTKMVFTLP